MKIEHQLFAHHYILCGDKDKAYKIAYPTASGEPLRNAARRLINNPDVRDYINNRMAEVQQTAAKEHHEEQKRREEAEYATLMLKRKTLRDMIDGRHKQLRHFKFKDHLETIEEALSPFAIIRAIELDTKLASEWYSRGAKVEEPASPAAGVQEEPKDKWIDFHEWCEWRYGPDYLPAMRARMIRDNPRMAEEYKKNGLRVLDHVPSPEEYQRMEDTQTKLREKLAEERNKRLAELPQPDPPSMATVYAQPADEESEAEEGYDAEAKQYAGTVQAPVRTVTTSKTITPVNKFVKPFKPVPPGVNPMSVPPPESRLQLTKEEIEKRLHDTHIMLTKNPKSMYYIPPKE